MDKKIGFSWLTQNPVGLQTKETIYLTPDAKKKITAKKYRMKNKVSEEHKEKEKMRDRLYYSDEENARKKD